MGCSKLNLCTLWGRHHLDIPYYLLLYHDINVNLTGAHKQWYEPRPKWSQHKLSGVLADVQTKTKAVLVSGMWCIVCFCKLRILIQDTSTHCFTPSWSSKSGSKSSATLPNWNDTCKFKGASVDLYYYQKNFNNVKHKCWLLGHRVSCNTRERRCCTHAWRLHLYNTPVGPVTSTCVCSAEVLLVVQ